MPALVEIADARQPAGEPRRRWFVSDDIDLVVRSAESGQPSGFQLCYDRGRSERALIWRPDCGFTHMAVDDGDRVGTNYKLVPILVPVIPDGPFAANRVADRFAEESAELPAEVTEFVNLKLRQHPDHVQGD